MENPRQKIKSIKNPIKHFFHFFNFIKSETSDSFVNHFDGHFAYLKTLDFYFKRFVIERAIDFFNDFRRTFPDTVTNTVFLHFSMTYTGTSQFCVHVTYKLFLSMFIF